jgi:ABC-2 type transport system ATP-binding protein
MLKVSENIYTNVCIENVSKEIGNINLIDNMNLVVENGKCVGIKCSEEVGLTLFKMIYGIIPPSKGTLSIDGIKIDKHNTKLNTVISSILKDEGLYERLTINEYLTFFKKIYCYRAPLSTVIEKLGLLDIQNIKIKCLTYSQKKRVSFARALLSGAKLLLIQEPTLNLDKESLSIIRETITYICSLGFSIIATSVSLEEIILLGGTSYTLDDKGFNAVHSDIEQEENTKEFNNLETNISIKVNKIPAKVDDKIIFFNPTEIIFIESLDGISYINVNDEKFKCTMTLNELETRLKCFGFFRCHRSYLVNLQMVRELVTWTRSSFSIILDDKCKSSIPLSKGKLNELKEILQF